MNTSGKVDTTYKIESLRTESPPRTPPHDSPSNTAPEKLFPQNPEPASSKEVLHDAPEVVEEWLASSRRPTSPFSVDETVVSSFPPLDGTEKGDTVFRRESEPVPEEHKTCGLPRRYLIAVIIAIWVILLGIGLGIGLGVGLKKDKASEDKIIVDPYCADNPDFCIGGSLGSNYFTTNGTFNGSGIALATEFWNHQERKIMTVYFQHWTGTIRSIQLTPKGDWLGGGETEVIATDAKNSTPISTVSYAVNGTAHWHLFYISTTNHVRQRVNSNSTNIWQDGPLNDLNLTVYSAPNVGLQACWYGNYYGDSDASKFPTRDGNNNTIPFDAGIHGIHLWYPSSPSVFQMYGWYEGQAQWASQHEFSDMNAHAGVGCYSWGPGSVTYAMLVNSQNVAEIWWKDTGTTSTGANTTTNQTSTHPAHKLNTWTKTPATTFSIPGLHPSTSLGYTEYLYVQLLDGTITGHDIDWKAEDTTSIAENGFVVGGARGPVKGIKGTHMSVTAVEDQSGGTSLYVFYQTRGDDLSVFVRDIKGGQWALGELPISDR